MIIFLCDATGEARERIEKTWGTKNWSFPIKSLPFGLRESAIFGVERKAGRKEEASAELFNPFRTLNTHMHSKASLMVNKHHSEPSLDFFLPGHWKAFALL